MGEEDSEVASVEGEKILSPEESRVVVLIAVVPQQGHLPNPFIYHFPTAHNAQNICWRRPRKVGHDSNLNSVLHFLSSSLICWKFCNLRQPNGLILSVCIKQKKSERNIYRKIAINHIAPTSTFESSFQDYLSPHRLQVSWSPPFKDLSLYRLNWI